MPTIAEIRQQYPQYQDMSDAQLADALHQKFYSDMPAAEFQAKIGYKPTGLEWTKGGVDPLMYSAEDAAANAKLQSGRKWENIGRAISLAGRMPLDAVASLPLAASDFGVGIRNLITGGGKNLIHGQSGDAQTASSMYNEALTNLGVASPKTPTEKVGQLVGTALMGSKLPSPEIANPAPAGFVRPQTVKAQTLQASQDAGYVVPPSTTNPTAVNKILEGGAGKLTTAQLASAKNTEATNALARNALGLTEDTPITPELLQSIRQTAHDTGYEPLRSIGTIRADTQYTNDLAKVTQKLANVEKSFPELADTNVTDLVQAMNKKSFDSSAAVDATSLLRERASDAFAQGNNALGKAYRQTSNALEGAIERALSRRGQAGADLLSNFRDARQLIAKTHTVEDALNASTGNVNAINLGQQLARGAPLSGDLKTAAQFAQAFPKAARDFNESLPGISPLDFYGAGGVSAATKQPWYLMYPFLRQWTRQALLSPAGQRLAVPAGLPGVYPQTAMGAAAAANTPGLLGQ